MAFPAERYNLEEVLARLDDEFDIPNDGIDSELDSEEEEMADEELEIENQMDNHLENSEDDVPAPDIKVSQSDDVQPPRKKGRKPVQRDFVNSEWSNKAHDTPGEKFTQSVGPATVMSPQKSAIDFFLLLFSNLIMVNIVKERNRYAMQSLEAQDKDPSEWTAKQITLPEIKAWLGLVMAMSIHKLPAIVDYWKDDWILGVPAFARMSRNRLRNSAIFACKQ